MFENLIHSTQGGVVRTPRTAQVTASPLMWIKALELAMDKLKIAGAELGQVRAVGGCAQQHGSVYWRKGAERTLQELDPSRFLHAQLQNAFSVRESPVWMDSSTLAECEWLEQEIGGADRLAEITGSLDPQTALKQSQLIFPFNLIDEFRLSSVRTFHRRANRQNTQRKQPSLRTNGTHLACVQLCCIPFPGPICPSRIIRSFRHEFVGLASGPIVGMAFDFVWPVWRKSIERIAWTARALWSCVGHNQQIFRTKARIQWTLSRDFIHRR